MPNKQIPRASEYWKRKWKWNVLFIIVTYEHISAGNLKKDILFFIIKIKDTFNVNVWVMSKILLLRIWNISFMCKNNCFLLAILDSWIVARWSYHQQNSFLGIALFTNHWINKKQRVTLYIWVWLVRAIWPRGFDCSWKATCNQW